MNSFYQRLAVHLPHRFLYFCAMQVFAYVTVRLDPTIDVTELRAMELLRMYEFVAFPGRKPKPLVPAWVSQILDGIKTHKID